MLALLVACRPTAPEPTSIDAKVEAVRAPAAPERSPPDEAHEAPPTAPDVLAEMLADARLSALVARAPEIRLQILLTPIEPGSAPVTHRFRVGEEYVFTASSIKTFASLAALLELQRLARASADSPVSFCPRPPDDAICPDAPTPDPTNLDGGTATLRHEIRKMHLVSNNESFNRLYDFVGHEAMNELAWALGFESLRIRHRMGQSYGLGRASPKVRFFPPRGRPVEIQSRTSSLELEPTEMPGIKVGVAHIGLGRKRVDEPRDFSRKNHVSLDDLHRLTQSIARPDLEGSVPLGLEPENHALLLEAMSESAVDSKNPRFTGARFSGRRHKLLRNGLTKIVPEEHLLYVNKPGKAYGFHVETAYVEDRRTGRAFVFTAALYCDDDGVVGDDRYTYDEVSRPFFLGMGELLAERVLSPTSTAAADGE